MNAELKNKPLRGETSWLPFVVAMVVIASIWALSGWIIWVQFGLDSGRFGDQFGAINALFSGLAFAGVIYAVLLQRKELQLQRHELELTRAELAGQREQLEAQNETFRRDSFENTFFQLLRLHNDIVNGIDLRKIGGNEVIAQGRDCFFKYYRNFKALWRHAASEDADKSEQERINATYLAFYKESESDLGHYFRSLYNIIKFVDNSQIEDKRLYTNLVRAQLSSYEVALLFYNCLSDLGEKFYPYVEKYALLKMVPKAELLNANQHYQLYAPSAFAHKESEGKT